MSLIVMPVSAGEKRHVCEFCEKSFSRGSHYNRHMLTHLGEKPHACDVCGKRFLEASNLRLHLMLHVGEKKHRCHVCQVWEKVFIVDVSLLSKI